MKLWRARKNKKANSLLRLFLLAKKCRPAWLRVQRGISIKIHRFREIFYRCISRSITTLNLSVAVHSSMSQAELTLRLKTVGATSMHCTDCNFAYTSEAKRRDKSHASKSRAESVQTSSYMRSAISVQMVQLAANREMCFLF